jgi:hypothetical protein
MVFAIVSRKTLKETPGKALLWERVVEWTETMKLAENHV